MEPYLTSAFTPSSELVGTIEALIAEQLAGRYTDDAQHLGYTKRGTVHSARGISKAHRKENEGGSSVSVDLHSLSFGKTEPAVWLILDCFSSEYMGPGPGLVTQFSTRNSTRVNLFSVELGIPHKTNKNQFNS
jgi:hypothetical protein